MNCNCVQDIQSKIIGHIHKDRAVIKATFMDTILMLAPGKLVMCTHSRVEVTLTGLMKSQVTEVVHTYCPFCGTKISKIADEEPTTPVTE